MNLDYIHIALILVFTILSVLFILLIIRYKGVSNRSEKIISKKTEKYDKEISIYQSEMKRLQFLLSNSSEKSIKEDVTNNISIISGEIIPVDSNADSGNIGELILDKEKLEQEKLKFQEKNKKLWEQSIAIHKEKERIDKLKKEIESEHKNLTDSITYARRIQTALLPSQAILENCFNEYFIFWRPLNIVSGDFYWVKQINNQIIVTVADCTGHGVPGAFMSALGIAFLNEIVSHSQDITANEILEKMRILVKSSLSNQGKDYQAKDGMDMALCIIDFEKSELNFSGANNPLFIYRDGQIIELEPIKNPIGIYLIEKQFVNQKFKLQAGDVCYLFSDGFQDEFGGSKGKKLTKGKFRNLLLEMNFKNLPLSEQHDVLNKFLIDWLGSEYKQIDDILVVGFKV